MVGPVSSPIAIRSEKLSGSVGEEEKYFDHVENGKAT